MAMADSVSVSLMSHINSAKLFYVTAVRDIFLVTEDPEVKKKKKKNTVVLIIEKLTV